MTRYDALLEWQAGGPRGAAIEAVPASTSFVLGPSLDDVVKRPPPLPAKLHYGFSLGLHYALGHVNGGSTGVDLDPVLELDNAPPPVSAEAKLGGPANGPDAPTTSLLGRSSSGR